MFFQDLKFILYNLTLKIFHFANILILAILFCSFSIQAFSQTNDCGNNAGFENGTTAGWVCKYGSYGSGPCPSGSCPSFNLVLNNTGILNASGINGALNNPNNRHTIVTGNGTDPNSNNNVHIVAPGSNYSFRLGNAVANGNGGNPNLAQAEGIRFSFLVTTQNAGFTYKYAAFLQDPGHLPEGQPRFEVAVMDSVNHVVSCGYYKVVAGSFNACPGTANFTAGPNDWFYNDWKDVGLDLTGYIGQTISVEFRTTDCFPSVGNLSCHNNYPGTHSAYAYIDAYCRPMVIDAPAVCTGSGSIQISAPPGYASYSWPAGQPGITGSPTTQYVTVNNPVPGTTYYVNLVSMTGCTTSASCTLSGIDVTLKDTTICNGQSSSITLTAIPFTVGNYTFAWTGPAGFNSTLQQPTISSPTQTSSYTLTMSSNNGCAVTKTATVTVLPKPVIAINSDTAICNGSNVQLSAAGGIKYSWSPSTGLNNPNSANPTATPQQTTNYSVIVTDANGCYNSAITTVTVNPAPNVTVNPNKGICSGNSTSLSSSGGISYSWNPVLGLSNPNVANPTASPLNTSAYTVTITNVNGCKNKASTIIKVNPLPLPKVNPSLAICYGQTAQLSVSGGNSYLWNPPTTLNNPTVSNPIANPTSNTNYVVTIVDANGCTNSASTTVTVNPLPVVNINSNSAICVGANTQLSASGGINYSWTPTIGLNNASISNPIAGPTTSTGYTVTVKDANGCISTGNTLVSVNPLPTVSVSPGASLCIGKNTQLTSSGGVSYSWSPSIGLDNAGISNPIANPLTTTTYSVNVTDANGCKGNGTVTVNVNSLPSVTVNPNKTICKGESTQLNASGGVTYLWSPSASLTTATASNPIANPTSSTNYIVTVADANGCTNSASTTVTVNPLPVVNVNSNSAICIGTNTQLSASGGINYSWTPTIGLNNASISNPIAGPTTSTSYTVTVKDANGCISTGNTLVSVNPLPTVSVSPAASLCIGKNTQLTSSGGVSYSWSPSIGLDNASISNPLANPLTTITYSVNVTDANGCKGNGTVTVKVNPLPSVTVNPKTSICKGESIQLNASGGVSYLWSPPASLTNATASNPIANPTSNTNYIVTVADVNGCTNSASTTITVNPLPLVNVNSNSAICIGANTQLSASGGINYSWTPTIGLNNANISNPVANPASSTSYTVTVTDANGCLNTGNTFVSVNPLPTVSVSLGTSLCIGKNTQLTSSGGANYSWSPSIGLDNASIFNPVATPLTTTTYSVNVIDANGCKGNGMVTVNVNSLPSVTVNPNATICNGESTQLNASGGVSYLWSPSASLTTATISNPIANPNSTTSYIVTVADANGCTNSASTTVTVNPLPVVNVNSNSAICIGTNTQLSACGGINYWWIPTIGLSNASISNPIANPATSTGYTVTVKDANGCINTGNTFVSVNPLPTVSVSPDASLCVGKNTQLTSSGGVSYSWSPSIGLDNASIFNPVATPLTTTTYSVNITDANGCKGNGTVIVNVNSLPSVTINPNTSICKGESTQLYASGGVSYLWSPSATLTNATLDNPIANPITTTNYKVTVANAYGCTNTGNTIVTVNSLPVVNVGPDLVICSGATMQLTASGGINYIWSPSIGLTNATINNPVANPTTTTTYSVNVTDANGCKGSGVVTLSVVPSPTAIAGPDKNICAGESVQLSAAGGEYYSWSPDVTLSSHNISNPIASPQKTTTYTVNVSSNSICPPAIDTVKVYVHPKPWINAGEDSTIMVGSEIKLHSDGGGVNYLWSPADDLSCADCKSPMTSPAITTTYIVSTIDEFGCRNQDTVTIHVEDILTLYLPNSFFPFRNSDGSSGHNTIFKVSGIGIHSLEFSIFNRWGELIFESTDPAIGWDGTFKGQPVQADVYVYIAQAKSLSGKTLTKTGTVTVLKE